MLLHQVIQLIRCPCQKPQLGKTSKNELRNTNSSEENGCFISKTFSWLQKGSFLKINWFKMKSELNTNIKLNLLFSYERLFFIVKGSEEICSVVYTFTLQIVSERQGLADHHRSIRVTFPSHLMPSNYLDVYNRHYLLSLNNTAVTFHIIQNTDVLRNYFQSLPLIEIIYIFCMVGMKWINKGSSCMSQRKRAS